MPGVDGRGARQREHRVNSLAAALADIDAGQPTSCLEVFRYAVSGRHGGHEISSNLVEVRTRRLHQRLRARNLGMDSRTICQPCLTQGWSFRFCKLDERIDGRASNTQGHY